jgi:hypothetical protein
MYVQIAMWQPVVVRHDGVDEGSLECGCWGAGSAGVHETW